MSSARLTCSSVGVGTPSSGQKLGIPYPLEGVPTPTDEQVKRAEDILNVTAYHK